MNTCICCGEIIPEGRQVCPNCENGVRLEEKQATSKTSDKFASDKWISVAERLPEANTEVLTYRKSGINLEWRWHTYWDNDEFSDCPVTHWMPLPEPPKGE